AFFVLSMGLGLPYLVLGVSSGLLTKLPRSGSWMEWVKHLLGVVLLGVAAFYRGLAVAPSKLAWVVPAALGLGGLYLGFLEETEIQAAEAERRRDDPRELRRGDREAPVERGHAEQDDAEQVLDPLHPRARARQLREQPARHAEHEVRESEAHRQHEER